MTKSATLSTMANGMKKRRDTAQTSWEDLPNPQSNGETTPQQPAPKEATSTGEIDTRRFSKVQPPEKGHPPGYNKKKRDIVKLILVVVAAALLRGDPKVATVLSVVAMICLKEGKLFSVKNLKWLGLCIMSCGMSLASWSLERASDEANEEKEYTLNSVLWSSAKIVQLCWGMTLTVFLVSAYVHGHNSLLEFDYLWDADKPPSGPRKEPPPKRYMLY